MGLVLFGQLWFCPKNSSMGAQSQFLIVKLIMNFDPNYYKSLFLPLILL